MHILFLSHYFPPEVNAPASRTFEHCRVWVESGHQVSVVTCVPNHPRGEIYPGFRNSICRKESRDGIDVYRLLTWVAPNRGFLRRTANYFFYLVMATLAAPFLPRVDVVVSTSPQFFCGLAGYFVSRLKRVPWVLEIRDLWPKSIVAVDAMRKSPVIRLLERMESFAYRKANGIVSVTDSFQSHIIARGGSEERLAVIKNGVNLDLFVPGQASKAFAIEHGLEDKFVAAYVGTHGMAHGLETILHAADRLRDRTNIVFLLVGEGSQRERIRRLSIEMDLHNVVMLPQLPKERMPGVWTCAGASLVVLRDQELFRSVIPSKIFESMAMETPVLLGVRGESQAIVEASGGGICIAPENADELAAAVLALSSDPVRHAAMAAAGRQFVQQNFDRKELAGRYEKLLEAFVRTDTERLATSNRREDSVEELKLRN